MALLLLGCVGLQRRGLHASRWLRSWRTTAREHAPCVTFTGGLPLSEEEQTQLLSRTQRIGLEKPELARALLRQLEEQGEAAAPKRMTSLSTLEKVAGAKLQRKQGRGKTALFAYLSDVDKARVLHLTKMEGADERALAKSGRTAFFAALPGEVKYSALRDWQRERAACQTTFLDRRDRSEISGRYVPLSRLELLKLALSQGVPMVGFGFADNFLMITFGGTIDSYFGLYVSLMAAAGLGNLCSNIVGLGLADYIEHASTKLGLPAPKLSPAQRETPLARMASFAGTACGVTMGCLLGMVPLWFMDTTAGGDAEEG